MSKKNLIIFPSLWEGIKELNNEQKGELFNALCLSFFEGAEPVINDSITSFVYKFYSSAIADSAKKYEAICEKRAEARRGKIKNKEQQTTTNNNKQEQKKTKSDFVAHKEKEKEKEKEIEKDKHIILADAVRAFNFQLSEKLPMVVTFNEKRKQKLASRWEEFKKVGEPAEVWARLLTIIKKSKFLTGEAGEWKCSFDWLVENSTNWLKVYEGQYNNSNNNQKGTAFQGGNYSPNDWA